VVNGIPVMLLDDIEQTGWWSTKSLEIANAHVNGVRRVEPARIDTNDARIHPHVQEAIAATSGYLYKSLIGRLSEYPIPELRLPPGAEKSLLDIGCNWGRWSIAAARKGYRVVGMDPNIDAVIAARQVAAELGATCDFVVGDARYLPFSHKTFDVVFSYSVIQHFSKEDAKQTLRGITSILRSDGFSFIQMPNKYGLRSAYHLARRGFQEGLNFDVRYWSPRELKETFGDIIGPTELSIDGFFGLGIQQSDINFLPRRYRAVVRASEMLRRSSRRCPGLMIAADSLYVRSRAR
jgi:2-polyprenyl-3-methyl-5-hydroxy-6-metoxy-1,4-benzoquinol methylase